MMNTDTDLMAVAAQLAASLAVVAELLDNVAAGEAFALDCVRDALAAAESAVEGTALGPIVPCDDSPPETWGDWAETRVRLADAFDDELVLIG